MATTEKTIEIPAAVLKAENITFDDTKAKLGADKTQEAIETVANIAKGRNQAHVFATTADMQAWLSNADNKGLWNKGDNIYIVELEVPDWWIAEVLEEADPDTGYYYKIGQLETQKVDLSTYLVNSFTANRALVSNSSGKVAVSAVTSTELGYLDGVTSAIQTQLNNKVTNSFTASRVLVSDSSGKAAASSSITTTELGYLDGVTSKIQTQLNKKMPISGGETTGQMQFIRNLGVTNVSYSQAGVSMIAPTNESASARAGIGFTNEGSNGAYLYLDTDGKLKFIDDKGAIKVITTTNQT